MTRERRLILVALTLLACLCCFGCCFADDSVRVMTLRGSHRSSVTLMRDNLGGGYIALPENHGLTVTLTRREWPFPKEQQIYGPPMVSPPARSMIGQQQPVRGQPVVNWYWEERRRPLSLRGSILPGPEGGMIIGGPLSGTIWPGEEGGMIIGGPLGGTILPGWKGGMVIGGP